jgi:ankyrin repeat protein
MKEGDPTETKEDASESYLAIARMLVDSKADLEAKNNAGRTPFHHACASGSLEMAEYLFECGSDPNVIDNAGATPLHVAAQGGHAGIVKFLLTVAKCDPVTGLVIKESSQELPEELLQDN